MSRLSRTSTFADCSFHLFLMCVDDGDSPTELCISISRTREAIASPRSTPSNRWEYLSVSLNGKRKQGPGLNIRSLLDMLHSSSL